MVALKIGFGRRFGTQFDGIGIGIGIGSIGGGFVRSITWMMRRINFAFIGRILRLALDFGVIGTGGQC